MLWMQRFGSSWLGDENIEKDCKLLETETPSLPKAELSPGDIILGNDTRMKKWSTWKEKDGRSNNCGQL